MARIQSGGWNRGANFVDIFLWLPMTMPQNILSSYLYALSVMFCWEYLHSKYLQMYMHHHWSDWGDKRVHLFTGKDYLLEWNSLLPWNTILNFNVKRNKKTPSSCFSPYGLITKYKCAFPLLLKQPLWKIQEQRNIFWGSVILTERHKMFLCYPYILFHLIFFPMLFSF